MHHAEATGACGAFHYFQLPLACCLTPGAQLLPAVGTIRPDLFQAGYEERESCEQTTSSPGIVRIGRGHVDGNGNTQRIHEDVPFPPLDVLVGIVATDPRRLLNRFHALGIHAGGTWVRMLSLSFAFSPVQRSQQERPGSFEVQTPEMGEDGFARVESWQGDSAKDSRCKAT